MSKRGKKEVEAIVSGMGVFVAIISSLVELVKKFGGTMECFYRLATSEGSGTLETIARFIADRVDETRRKFTRLISGGESIVIEAVNGDEVLADAKDLFAHIDPDFKDYGADEPGYPTVKTLVDVREMIEDATFAKMFGELDFDVRKICFTQHQIKNFVRNHRKWLRTDGFATFFLFISKGNIFVAGVYVHSDGRLEVGVGHFEYSLLWSAEYRSRVVVRDWLDALIFLNYKS